MMKRTETRTAHGNPALSTTPVERRPMRHDVIDATTNNPADLDRRLDSALEETSPPVIPCRSCVVDGATFIRPLMRFSELPVLDRRLSRRMLRTAIRQEICS
ncbi:hypothetical protein [Microvirga sp. VF16]|uniref:hypothetical protein n=1 Tax=Microvirga sp. VF16 TaxID=2807101 RepID=UPI00193CDEDA|nr:hypothetical protein [Microvirga sp. VF16]QRM35966.1 hypothetical protein JO965_47185 [Microvirga sp. VF16]